MVSESMPSRPPGHVWTWGGVLVLLAGGAIGAQCLSRSQSAADMPLERIALAATGWERVENVVDRDPDKGWPEAKQVRQAYEDAEGRIVRVTLKGTYTRLGALRDYSLGSIADGWVVEDSAEVSLEGVQWGSGPVHARCQRLSKGDAAEVALSWYCSVDEVVTDLREAALAGWRGRLLGKAKPWAQVYVVVDVEGEAVAEAEAIVKAVGASIAPQLRDVLVDASG